MKKLVALILAVVMLFSISACGTTSSKGSAKDDKTVDTTKPVTIKVANYAILEKGYEQFWTNVKKNFEAKYPNITIEWVTAPYGDILNQVVNMAGGGNKVDLMFGEMIWIPTLVDAGLAVPVKDVLSKEFVSDYYQNILDAHSIEGDVYGIPLYVSASVLYYNKNLFKLAGLDPEAPPKTYDEMLTMADKLSKLKTADGNKVYAFGQPTASVSVVGSSLTAMVSNFGGQVMDKNGKLSVDNDGFKKAMEMLKLLNEKGYNPQNAKPKDLRNLFALGQLAMYYDQTWGYNGITSINPDAKNFIASAMPLKGGSGEGKTTLQAHSFIMMDNGAEKKEAVRKFVEYVVTPDVLSNYLKDITPAYPAKKSMEKMDAVVNNPILKGAVKSTEASIAVPLIPKLNDFNLELCSLAQAITVNGKQVPQAIDDFKASATKILGK